MPESCFTAFGAASFVTCDSFGVWLELASDLMAGGDAGFFPAFFGGPVAFNKFISVDASATFFVVAGPELCAEALLVRRMPYPRTKINSSAPTTVRAMRKDDHPARRSRHSHPRTTRAIVALASVALEIIALTSVLLAIIALEIIALAIIETSTESWFGGSAGSDGNRSGGKISRAPSSGSGLGASFESCRILAAGETGLGAGCGAAAGSSTSPVPCPALMLTGCFGRRAASSLSGGLRMKSGIGAFK